MARAGGPVDWPVPLLSSWLLTLKESAVLLISMKTNLLLLLLLSGGLAIADELPLPKVLGMGRMVVEVAPLEVIGRALSTPEGWGFHQARESDDSLFRVIAGDGFSTGLLYFDKAGNLLLVDGDQGAEKRIGRRCSEAEKLVKVRNQSITDAWRQALSRRAAGDRPGEVRYLLALSGTSIRDSAEILDARSRLKQLEKIALEEFWKLLASEGSVSNANLVKELRKLEKLDAGLGIAAAVTRERLRIEAGITVKGDS
ncbi:MAG TPA: hypothetical protein EYN79_08580 [Planctomycetes bacterium]|nr:hypothetical protein [Planctomycetota bacterium]HIN80829.1 hypothetical protein [Planctomycetota bacterium]